MPFHLASPSQPAGMITRRHVLSDGGAVFIKDTDKRFHLALTRGFLVRWIGASALGNLLFTGLRIASFAAIALPVFGGAATSQTMPREKLTASASGIDVKDEMGRVVRIPQPVRRIVSLAPSLTETLFALGLGDRVVGDTDFCNYPPEAKQKPHVGGPVDPSIEAIAALHPDLVVVTRDINRRDSVHSLEQLRIPVYATDPQSVEQVLTSTERLARLLPLPLPTILP